MGPGPRGNRHVSNIVNFRNKNLPKFAQKFNQTLSMTVVVNAAIDWNLFYNFIQYEKLKKIIANMIEISARS